jgi:phage gpG-like protein
LHELAQRTGGEMFMASAPAHASVAARRILGELRHQYVLAFEASTRPGWRPLEVRAKDGHIVRARSGYMTGNRTTMGSGGH